MPDLDFPKLGDCDQLTYYDLMAMLCWKIAQSGEESYKALYQKVCNGLDGYISAAKKLYPELLSLSNATPPLYCSPNSNAKKRLLSFAHQVKDAELDNLALLVGAVAAMDSLMVHQENIPKFLKNKHSDIISQEKGVSDSVYSFEALNTCTNQRFGVLLPRLPCVWEREDGRTLDTVGMQPLSLALKNHIWLSNTKSWDITNLYLDIRKTGLCPERIRNVSAFQILSSPICNVAPFQTELNLQDKAFYIHYLTEEDARVVTSIKKVINQAVSQKADIVVFPEMMASATAIESSEAYISALRARGKPKLYFMPTTEQCCGGQWKNTLRILDQDGLCVFEYHKRQPFQYDKKQETAADTLKKKVSYFEPISPDNKVCIIHVPGIGRIGMLICSDIFEEGYLYSLVRQFQLTLVVYPVFTFGKDLMMRMVEITKVLSCDIILCNTCSAWDDTLIHPSHRKVNTQFHRDFVNVYYPNGHKMEPEIPQKLTCRGENCHGCCFQTVLATDYKGQTAMSEQFEFEV